MTIAPSAPAELPPRDRGYETPDYSYLEDLEPPQPQAYEGDTLAGEPGFEHVDVIPRLGPDDGFVLGPDGKMHFTQLDTPANPNARFDHPTGDFRTAQRRGAVAVHDQVMSGQRGKLYRGGIGYTRPHASHRAE